MPIQFRCHRCRKQLSVTRRKAGSRTRCPACGADIQVPADVFARSSVKSIAPAGAGTAEPEPGDFGDVALLVGELPQAETGVRPKELQPADRAESQPAQPAEGDSRTGWESLAYNYVLVSRTAVYAQAILLVLAGLVGFMGGYWAGLRVGAQSAATVDAMTDELDLDAPVN